MLSSHNWYAERGSMRCIALDNLNAIFYDTISGFVRLQYASLDCVGRGAGAPVYTRSAE
jgi:hypothetical protein